MDGRPARRIYIPILKFRFCAYPCYDMLLLYGHTQAPLHSYFFFVFFLVFKAAQGAGSAYGPTLRPYKYSRQ